MAIGARSTTAATGRLSSSSSLPSSRMVTVPSSLTSSLASTRGSSSATSRGTWIGASSSVAAETRVNRKASTTARWPGIVYGDGRRVPALGLDRRLSSGHRRLALAPPVRVRTSRRWRRSPRRERWPWPRRRGRSGPRERRARPCSGGTASTCWAGVWRRPRRRRYSPGAVPRPYSAPAGAARSCCPTGRGGTPGARRRPGSGRRQ